MATLTSLPAEVLGQIFEYLHADRYSNFSAYSRDCAALANTCSVLAPTALSSLHTRYEAQFLQPNSGLLMHLRRYPVGYQGIRHIKINHPSCVLRATFASWTEDIVRQKWTKERRRNPDELAKMLRKCPTFSAHHLLLDQAANVQTLEFCAGNIDDQGSWAIKRGFSIAYLPILHGVQVLLRSPAKIASYHKLHTLRVDLGGTFTFDIERVFALPALRTLSLIKLGYTCIFDEPRAFAAKAPIAAISSVTTLQFFDCVLPCAMVYRFIQCCKALASFSWFDDVWRGQDDILCGRVMSALEPHRNTLTSLCLRPCGLNFADQGHRPNILVQGFESFKQLECLRVPFMLMGWLGELYAGNSANTPVDCEQFQPLLSLLPPRLRNLTLDIDGENSPNGIEEYLITAVAAPLNGKTSLQSLAIPCHGLLWTGTTPMNFCKVAEACNAMQVAFTYSMSVRICSCELL